MYVYLHCIDQRKYVLSIVNPTDEIEAIENIRLSREQRAEERTEACRGD
jgi:hypothetical protein